MTLAGEIDKFSVSLNTRSRKFIEEFGIELTRRTAEKTPVLTGLMQKSWGFTKKQQGIEVYNTAPYSYWVEFGTEKMAPRAPLRTTLLEHEAIAKVALERTERTERTE